MEMAYCRVSSKDQNVERQLQKFRELGIEERYVFIDKMSGKNFNRPQYQAMRLMIREGDLVYLDSLDRLGRNYDGIVDEWKYITRELNANIICLENSTLFDSRHFRSMNEFGKVLEDQFLSLLAYVAEQERKKNLLRQAEGIAVAKENGVEFGRPKKKIDDNFYHVYLKWKAKEITGVTARSILNMKHSTFYRRVKEHEDKLQGKND